MKSFIAVIIALLSGCASIKENPRKFDVQLNLDGMIDCREVFDEGTYTSHLSKIVYKTYQTTSSTLEACRESDEFGVAQLDRDALKSQKKIGLVVIKTTETDAVCSVTGKDEEIEEATPRFLTLDDCNASPNLIKTKSDLKKAGKKSRKVKRKIN